MICFDLYFFFAFLQVTWPFSLASFLPVVPLRRGVLEGIDVGQVEHEEGEEERVRGSEDHQQSQERLPPETHTVVYGKSGSRLIEKVLGCANGLKKWSQADSAWSELGRDLDIGQIGKSMQYVRKSPSNLYPIGL